MSFLSNLLNPKTALRGLIDPAGATISAATGTSGPKSMLDPAGLLSGGGSGGGAGASTGTPAASSPNYYGDQSDPQYGSLLQPFDAEQFYKYEDPGYWFRLQQGQQALLNSASAGSGALSGAALKDLLGYNQDMASTEYGNAFNRYQTQQGNIFSRLSSLAGLGQNAAAGVGAQGTTLAGNAGQALQNAGSAAGGGIVGAGNALGNGLTNYWLMQQFQPHAITTGTGGV